MNKREKILNSIKQFLYTLTDNDFKLFKELSRKNFRMVDSDDKFVSSLSFSDLGPFKSRFKNYGTGFVFIFKMEIILDGNNIHYISLKLKEETKPMILEKFIAEFFLTSGDKMIDEELKYTISDSSDKKKFINAIIKLYDENLNIININKISNFYSRTLVNII